MSTVRAIDVHQHILPPRYVDAVGADRLGSLSSSGRLPTWSVEAALDRMDEAAVATALLSISAPGVSTLSSEVARTAAREANEFAADIVRDHPRRFGMFATVPMHTIDGALAEIAYALGPLGADGICLLTNYSGAYLGDSGFTPLLEELEERKAIVFVHPTQPAASVAIDGFSLSMLEFPFDTTRAMASLTMSGAVTANPSIRWIFSHAGGTMPFLAGRFDVLLRNRPALAERVGGDFASTLGSLYVDTALSADCSHFAALRTVWPDSRALFGSDYPFGPPGQVLETRNNLDRLGLPDASAQQIIARNALDLFPRLRST